MMCSKYHISAYNNSCSFKIIHAAKASWNFVFNKDTFVKQCARYYTSVVLTCFSMLNTDSFIFRLFGNTHIFYQGIIQHSIKIHDYTCVCGHAMRMFNARNSGINAYLYQQNIKCYMLTISPS